MLVSKCVNVQSTVVSDAIAEYYFTALNDISSQIKINNNPVMELDPNFCNRNFRGIYNFVGNGGSNKDGAHLSYFKFVNDFAHLNCGFIHTTAVSTIGRIDESNITVDNDISVYQLNNNGDNSVWFNPVYDATIPGIKRLPYYMHYTTDIAYFALGHTCNGVTFAKLKSIDDPTNYRYVVIITSKNGYATESYTLLGKYQFIKIFDNSALTTDNYTTFINRKLNDVNKSVIEKFVYDGYYSNELYTFDGLCPSGYFSINNNTYLNIGFNLYIKITN